MIVAANTSSTLSLDMRVLLLEMVRLLAIAQS
jgi:hypothetical protein